MTMHRIGLFALIVVLGILAPGNIQIRAEDEQGAVLFIAPSRLVVEPGERVAVVTAANKSKLPRRYDIGLIDQVMHENGITSTVETFDYSVKRMLRFQPKRFTLQPGESQTVRIMVMRPADLADGDYHSHLLFREVPLDVKSKEQLEAERKADEESKQAVSFSLHALYGVGIPLVVQQGKIIADMSIDDVRVEAAAEGKERQIVFDFTRTGNSEAAGKLSAEYVQDGKPPVPVIETQWIRLYREVEKISKKINLINIPKDARGGKIVIKLMKSETDDSKTVKKEIAFNG